MQSEPGKLTVAELQVQNSAENSGNISGPKLSRKAITPRDELDGPYVKINIQNTTAYMLLDIGSNCTILNPAVYDKLDNKPQLSYSGDEISVVNGGKVPSVGHAEFSLQVGDIKICSPVVGGRHKSWLFIRMRFHSCTRLQN